MHDFEEYSKNLVLRVLSGGSLGDNQFFPRSRLAELNQAKPFCSPENELSNAPIHIDFALAFLEQIKKTWSSLFFWEEYIFGESSQISQFHV